MQPSVTFTGSGSAEAGVIMVTDDTSTGSSNSTTIWPAWCKTRRCTESDYQTTSLGSTGSGGSADTLWTAWWEDRWPESATSANTVWTSWVKVHCQITSATSATSDAWIIWNAGRRSSVGSNFRQRNVRISDEEYQARRARDEAARLEREARYRAESLERERAQARARLLLREQLTEEQKAELADKRYFSLAVLDSRTGERRNYRIHQGRAGNVEQVDDQGRRIKRFCIHPSIACPDEDTMLAQKLLLETREDDFRRIANHS
jgi:hypothetical protein